MIDDPDIFRAAKLIIDQQGNRAATFASERADMLSRTATLTAHWCGAGSSRR